MQALEELIRQAVKEELKKELRPMLLDILDSDAAGILSKKAENVDLSVMFTKSMQRELEVKDKALVRKTLDETQKESAKETVGRLRKEHGTASSMGRLKKALAASKYPTQLGRYVGAYQLRRQMSTKVLAGEIGVHPKHLGAVLKAKSPLTSNMAEEIKYGVGGRDPKWTEMVKLHRAYITRKNTVTTRRSEK